MYQSKTMVDLGKNTGQMSYVLEQYEMNKSIRLPKVSTTHNTRNTTVPCRNCLGMDSKPTGIQVIQHSDGISRVHHCIACKGTKEIKN